MPIDLQLKTFIYSARFWLRAAAVITALLALGHTLGGLSHWSPAGETLVLRAMRSFSFDANGVRRTYFDFYLGFGWIIAVYLSMQAALVWRLSSAAAQPDRRFPLVVVTLANFANAIIAAQLLFVVPALSFALIGITLAVGYVQSHRTSRA